MPDWKYFKDRWGNEYYYDRAGSIRIPLKGEKHFMPVYNGGVEYFYNLALELIKSHQVEDAIYYLKSMVALESGNNRVHEFQKKAVEMLSKVRSQQGIRFIRYSMNSSLLLLKERKIFRIINDSLGYSLEMKHRPILIKKSWKYRDTGQSAKFGVSPGEDNKYDYLFGIESRIYRFRLHDIDRAISSWIVETGFVGFKRTLLRSGANFKIYSYQYPKSPFLGIEGFFINGRRFFYLRTMCHSRLKPKVFPEMEKLVGSFHTFL